MFKQGYNNKINKIKALRILTRVLSCLGVGEGAFGLKESKDAIEQYEIMDTFKLRGFASLRDVLQKLDISIPIDFHDRDCAMEMVERLRDVVLD